MSWSPLQTNQTDINNVYEKQNLFDITNLREKLLDDQSVAVFCNKLFMVVQAAEDIVGVIYGVCFPKYVTNTRVGVLKIFYCSLHTHNKNIKTF